MSWRYSGKCTIRAFQVLVDLVLSISKLLHLNINELPSHYQIWDPSTRTYIRLVEGSLTIDGHTHSASAAADRSASDPRQLFAGFDSGQVSHVLFAVRPEKLSAVSKTLVSVQVPTSRSRGSTLPDSRYFSADFLAPLD